MAHAKIYHDPRGMDYPWFYTVDAYVPGDPEPYVIDYGSRHTWPEALESVRDALTNRGGYDNPPADLPAPELPHTAPRP